MLYNIFNHLFYPSFFIFKPKFLASNWNPVGVNLQQMKTDSSGNIYVISTSNYDGIVHRSTDGGLSWDSFTDGVDITFDGSGYYYKITGEPDYRVSRSIDGGINWVVVAPQWGNSLPRIETNSRGDILYEWNQELRFSTDFGNTWNTLWVTNGEVKILKITKEDYIYIYSDGSI